MAGAPGVSVDAVYNSLGGKGYYQVVQFVLVMISWFSSAFQLLSIIFIGQKIPHQCASVSNKSDQGWSNTEALNASEIGYESCSVSLVWNTTNSSHTQTFSCQNGWTYQSEKKASIVSEWDLVCDKNTLSPLSQTLFIAGQGVGAIVYPALADRFGRKPLFVSTHLSTLIFGIALAFSPNYITFAVLRFLLGSLQQGMVLISVTLALEMFQAGDRLLVGALSNLLWAISVTSLTPFAYFLRFTTWRNLQLALCSVSLFSFLQIWFVDESLRWSVANGKDQNALKIMKKLARMNKADPCEAILLLKRIKRDPKEIISTSSKDISVFWKRLTNDVQLKLTATKKYTFLDILRTRQLLIISVVLWFTWFTNSLVYFGLYLTTSSLTDDKYLNYFLNAIAEAPAAVMFWCLIDRIGRKKTVMFFHILAGIPLIISTIIKTATAGQAASVTATVFAVLGKIGISASFTTLYIYTSEIFPTNLRNLGTGACSLAARVGGMLAPYSGLLAAKVKWAPGTIFGVCCMIVVALIMFLPETKDRELPQTIEQCKDLYKPLKDDLELPQTIEQCKDLYKSLK